MRNRLHSEAEIEQMLSRYLQGSLSNVDKRILDKYALDDPFLAEAMEGYIQEGLDLRDGEIKALRQAIVTPRKVSTRKLPVQWMRWAAVILGLAFVGIMGYQLMDSKDSNLIIADHNDQDDFEPIAQAVEKDITSEEPELRKEPPVEKEALDKVEASEMLATKASSNKLKKIKKSSSKKANNTKSTVNTEASDQNIENKASDVNVDIMSNTAYVLDGIKVDKETFESDVQDTQEKNPNKPQINSEDKNETLPVSKTEEDIAADAADEEIAEADFKRYGNVYIEEKTKKKSSATTKYAKRIIAVKVVGEDGAALIGANVFAGDEGTITNFDGYATFEVDTSTLVLNTTYTGYENTSKLLIDTLSFYRIVMLENAVLDEVVVSNIPSPKTIAAPEGGWNQFEIYANQQLSNLDRVSQSSGKKRGEVEVQFKIKENGNLMEFLVIKSLDPAYDQAVINMIKSYGKWLTNPPETEMVTTFKYIF